IAAISAPGGQLIVAITALRMAPATSTVCARVPRAATYSDGRTAIGEIALAESGECARLPFVQEKQGTSISNAAIIAMAATDSGARGDPGGRTVRKRDDLVVIPLQNLLALKWRWGTAPLRYVPHPCAETGPRRLLTSGVYAAGAGSR
ncbi:MAG TPA: hypothetical protein VGS41_18290, partial [Chthonomonadales bacterium]|nr:hypothetical protein [Chthonomonadales bacterium]